MERTTYRHRYGARLARVGLVSVLAGSGADCGSSGAGESDRFSEWPDAGAAVDAWATSVVVGTYELLAIRLRTLRAATERLAASPARETLAEAQEAWLAAREPWEASEGFLFGPVSTYGFDPALDSWPVDRTSLDRVLAGGDTLTFEYVAALDDPLQGFHTAEYLLFGQERDRVVAELGARELAYLAAVTRRMSEVGGRLRDAWVEGIDGAPAYLPILTTAGQPENQVYPSLEAAAQELVFGAIGILDEVANGKIADPYDQADPTLVESQFSLNSLTDFANNIRSVRNSYLCLDPATGLEVGPSLGDFVATLDPALDARLRAELDAALAALAAVPPPFRRAISDPAAADEIEVAQHAIRTAQSTFESDVLPLVSQ